MARQPKTQKAEAETLAVEAPKKSLFDRFGGYLDTNDWHYSADQEKGCFSMGCRIKDASVRVFIEVFEGEEWSRVMVFSAYPVFVPEQRRNAAIDALNRINHRLVFGNFEMDPADGEIRFRTTVESGKELGDEMFERVLNSNLSAADRHFGALMAIAFGNGDPATVIEMATRPEDGNLQ